MPQKKSINSWRQPQIITIFDRSSCRLLREEIDAALIPVADKFGISFKGGPIRFSSDNMTIKIEAATKDSDGQVNSKEKTNFDLYGKSYGFEPEDFGAAFKLRGESYEIIGLTPRSRKFPVLGKRTDGKVFKFNSTDVLMAMGRKVCGPLQALREL